MERKGGEHGAKRVKDQGLHKVEEEFSKQIQAQMIINTEPV